MNFSSVCEELAANYKEDNCKSPRDKTDINLYERNKLNSSSNELLKGSSIHLKGYYTYNKLLYND